MIDNWMLEHATPLGLEEAIDCDMASSWTGPIWGTRLKCPSCGSTNLHIIPPQRIPSYDDYEAGWGGRGDLVVLPLWGECEHTWELCFGSHKGETFVFIRVPESAGRAA